MKKQISCGALNVLAAATLTLASGGLWAACSYTVTNNWGSGFTGEITVTNDTAAAVSNWSVSWQETGVTVTNAWNATLSGANPYTASSLNWNGALAPKASASFGFQATGKAGTPKVNGVLCGAAASSNASVAASSKQSSLIASSASSKSAVISSSSSKSSLAASSTQAQSSSVANESVWRFEENELGACNTADVKTNQTGYTGTGYIDTVDTLDASMAWSISAASAKTYAIEFRFANGASARTAKVLVNNSQIQLQEFPATGGWNQWQTLSLNVPFKAGTNSVQIVANAASGLANVDYIAVAGNGITPAACPSVSSAASSSAPAASSSSRSSAAPLVNQASPIGFASLNGGTTGGKNGQTVSVSNYADLKRYAESAQAYTIMINGTISNGSAGGQIRVASNKSLVGVGSSAFLSGVGIDISGSSSNVIVRNLKMTLVGTSSPSSVNGGDVISIYGNAPNIWIDHCELYSENPDVQTNIDKYDGLIDIKGQTSFITLSYNYLHDHHKGGLVGAADNDLFTDRKVTMHHNYYKNVKLRVPMYRGATGHFFNNYIVGAKDATEIRANTCVRVERNYYEALHYSIYTTSDSPGKTERIGNIEVSRTSRAYPANCTADISYNYSSVLINNAADVKTKVPQTAGVGKI